VAAGIVDRETLDAAGELLDAHIRLEERQLFPLIEELVPDDELRRLGLADRDATCAVRRPPPSRASRSRAAAQSDVPHPCGLAARTQAFGRGETERHDKAWRSPADSYESDDR
jgi:hypothetical protein